MAKAKIVKALVKGAAKVVKKAVKKKALAKKAAKKVAKKAVKKTPAKKVAKAPAKKAVEKTAPKRPVQGPITRQQAAGSGPVQGPSNYKGRYYKDKAKAAKALKESQEKFMNAAGTGAKEARKEGASAARKKIKKSLSKINRDGKKVKKAIMATKKKVGKALKSPVGAIAAYEGTKAGYKKLTGSGKKKKTNGSYFTQAELDAARKRLYGTK